MATFNAWSAEFRPGGWVRARCDTVSVYLQLRPEDDRERSELRIHVVVVSADEPITDSIWQNIPIRELEMHLSMLPRVTSPQVDHTAEQLRKTAEVDGLSIADLERYFEETEALPLHVLIPGRATVNGVPLADQFKLEKSADGRITDDFLRNLAGMYLAAVEAKQAPAPAIAARANAPVRTVHRWVAEARRRGFLPPATKGKVG